eukprot:364577-Chlamydomonas_euryale.AAC.13
MQALSVPPPPPVSRWVDWIKRLGADEYEDLSAMGCSAMPEVCPQDSVAIQVGEVRSGAAAQGPGGLQLCIQCALAWL